MTWKRSAGLIGPPVQSGNAVTSDDVPPLSGPLGGQRRRRKGLPLPPLVLAVARGAEAVPGLSRPVAPGASQATLVLTRWPATGTPTPGAGHVGRALGLLALPTPIADVEVRLHESRSIRARISGVKQRATNRTQRMKLRSRLFMPLPPLGWHRAGVDGAGASLTPETENGSRSTAPASGATTPKCVAPGCRSRLVGWITRRRSGRPSGAQAGS
jgi:hypothetical protein